jgi:putative oxidoreductase
MFIMTGGAILFGLFTNKPMPMPPLTSQMGVGGILQFFGGILIVLGLLTRPVAFVLSGMMAVTYWQFHAPKGPWPPTNMGMPSVLLCFIFLYLAAQGGGAMSLDALLFKRAKPEEQ